MKARRMLGVVLACMAGVWLAATAVHAELADVFSNELAGLELEPVGQVAANTVAATYPVASASSSVIYTYNAQLEAFERRPGVLGPIFGERAETIGERQLNLSLTYSYVNPQTFNGQSLDHLVNQPEINGSVVSFPVPGGVILADGRFSNFLPIQVNAALDIDAHIITPSATYGLTPNWDVNLTLPLVDTSLRVTTELDVPDPRLPQFALAPGNPNAFSGPGPSSSQSSFGVGDLLLRSKYVVLRDSWVDVAAGLGVSFPTGNTGDFHGTGTYRVQPALIISKILNERVEPLLNLGVDINADDIGRSAFRWAVGLTGEVIKPLTVAVVFLGRNEFNAQTEPIANPFFLQIERNDIYDFSAGLRWLVYDTAVVSVNAILPMNRDGFRSNVIPTLSAEYTF